MSRVIVAVVAASVALAGCRDKDAGSRDAAPAGPTMPTGMLVPGAVPPPTAEEDGGPLRVARNVKGGAWAELQLAKPGDKSDRTDFEHWRADSRFVSLEAMTLMHEAFARALPGFNLFLPRLFGAEALTKLESELEAFAQRSSGPLVETARELGLFAKDAAAKGQSVWVLGP